MNGNRQALFRKGHYLLLLTGAAGASLLQAQDPFPDPIPVSGIAVTVRDAVTLPDSSANRPPRISVVTQDPSGRLFANDQRGPLYTFNEVTGSFSEYLDLRDYAELQIVSTFEAGFQGFAFHPGFFSPESPGFGKFYTIHSCGNISDAPDFDPGGTTDFDTLVLEWETADPAANVYQPVDPQTPFREIMRLAQPYGNHNAGLIAFNPLATAGHPDYGNLYIAIGDGGSGGDPQENGQDPSNPFGAILRIDPLGTNSPKGRYGIVAGNALAADGEATTLAEIFCYGLRNPQRFGWDLVTGQMFIADIGQNAVEEINLGQNGGNYGWDTREGSFAFEGAKTPGMLDPVAEYDHTNPVADPPTFIGSRAVTVGEVARGLCLPDLEGKLLLGDFPTGSIFLLDVDTDPLDGGQDGLSVLTLLDASGHPQSLMDLINAVRASRGLSDATRTDLRFSVNTPGRLFISNKQDGVIRRVMPTTTPSLRVERNPASAPVIRFEGILQESEDLQIWNDARPQPVGGEEMPVDEKPLFYRSVRR